MQIYFLGPSLLLNLKQTNKYGDSGSPTFFQTEQFAKQFNPEKFNLVQLEKVAQLDEAYFPEPWSLKAWSELLLPSMQNFQMLTSIDPLARDFLLILDPDLNDELMGFIFFELNCRDSFAHLYKILTHPKDRKKGRGSKLLNRALEMLCDVGIRQVYLEVAEKNTAAIKLYEKWGFKALHLKKKFYSNGDNAWVMEKILP